MKIQKYYLVQKRTGSYDDISWNYLFITDKEYKAKFYVSKANEVFGKYKDYYQELLQQASYNHLLDWNHAYERVTMVDAHFLYIEIELRKNFKI